MAVVAIAVEETATEEVMEKVKIVNFIFHKYVQHVSSSRSNFIFHDFSHFTFLQTHNVQEFNFVKF